MLVVFPSLGTTPRARTRITRSHEFEVGALEVTIQGEHFGTEANGNMAPCLPFGVGGPEFAPILPAKARATGQSARLRNCRVWGLGFRVIFFSLNCMS